MYLLPTARQGWFLEQYTQQTYYHTVLTPNKENDKATPPTEKKLNTVNIYHPLWGYRQTTGQVILENY